MSANGILLIDKPAGITSHDVVWKARKILGTKRIGHTGTLDPFATGLMVLLVGQATRLAQFLDKDTKEYIAVIRFGFETDTGDLTGTPRQVPGPINDPPTIASIQSILMRFCGTIEQVPPMYSAKKIDGKKLYELARAGNEIERKAVAVTIYKIEIVAHSDLEKNGRLTIRVVCSAGTYIRTLAEDIGKAVGTGAHLESLRRIAAGKFSLNDSRTLEDLALISFPETALRPMELAIAHLPEFILSGDRVEKTRNGLSTRVLEHRFQDGELVKMTSSNNDEVIAIGIYESSENSIRPKVVLR